MSKSREHHGSGVLLNLLSVGLNLVEFVSLVIDEHLVVLLKVSVLVAHVGAHQALGGSSVRVVRGENSALHYKKFLFVRSKSIIIVKSGKPVKFAP
jgi:hypothetical protein